MPKSRATGPCTEGFDACFIVQSLIDPVVRQRGGTRTHARRVLACSRQVMPGRFVHDTQRVAACLAAMVATRFNKKTHRLHRASPIPAGLDLELTQQAIELNAQILEMNAGSA